MFLSWTILAWVMFVALTAALLFALLAFLRNKTFASFLLLAGAALWWLPKLDERFFGLRRTAPRLLVPCLSLIAIACVIAFIWRRPWKELEKRYEPAFILTTGAFVILMIVNHTLSFAVSVYSLSHNSIPSWGLITTTIKVGCLGFCALAAMAYIWYKAARLETGDDDEEELNTNGTI